MQEKRSFSSRNAMGSPSSSASLHYLTSILNPQDRPPSILNPQNLPPSVLKILSEGTRGGLISRYGRTAVPIHDREPVLNFGAVLPTSRVCDGPRGGVQPGKLNAINSWRLAAKLT